MEDFVAVVPRARCGYLYAAVFDGHAGSAAARFLADRLYPALSQTIEETNYVDCEIPGAAASTSADGCGGGGGGTNLATSSLDGLCCPVDMAPALADTFDALDSSAHHKPSVLELIMEESGMQPARAAAATTAGLAIWVRLFGP